MNETWKSIDGYKGIYEVSNLGNVRSIDRISYENKYPRKLHGKTLSAGLSGQGYYSVILYKNKSHISIRVHRLVAFAFLENKNGYAEVNHINGHKTDNRACNLEWCTREYNIKHAIKNGLFEGKKGENHPATKLTNNDIFLIRKSKDSIKELSIKYNITKVSIRNIRNKKTWKHII
jgi:hypothetical protein